MTATPAIEDVVEAHILETPTAYLHSDADPSKGEEERQRWLADRRLGITATDLPKILNLSKYGNELHVWLDKRGELPDEGIGEAGEWGHILEDVVAREWARRHADAHSILVNRGPDGLYVERIGILANVERPWMLASLDRLVWGCPLSRDAEGGPSCAVEVKTRSAFKGGDWRDDQPDDVLAQTAWQRMVTGLDHIHTAALIGGQKLETYVYEADQELEAYLLAKAERTWSLHLAGIPPEVDADALLLDALNRLHINREGAVEVDIEEVRRLELKRKLAKERQERWEQVETAAKARLVRMLGDVNGGSFEAGVAEGHDKPALTYKPGRHQVRDMDRLKTEWPDAYAACVRLETNANPTLRVAPWVTAKPKETATDGDQ